MTDLFYAYIRQRLCMKVIVYEVLIVFRLSVFPSKLIFFVTINIFSCYFQAKKLFCQELIFLDYCSRLLCEK